MSERVCDTQLLVDFNDAGLPSSMRLGEAAFPFKDWSWAIELDDTLYTFPGMKKMDGGHEPVDLSRVGRRALTEGRPACTPGSHRAVAAGEWESEFLADRFRIMWHFRIPEGQDFLSAWIEVRSSDGCAFVVRHVTMCSIVMDGLCSEMLDYWTMEGCPLAVIARGRHSSLVLVSEVPFVSLVAVNPRMAVEFSARLPVPQGQPYVSEPIYVLAVAELGEDVIGSWLPTPDGSLCMRGGLPNPQRRLVYLSEARQLRALMSWRMPKRRAGLGVYCDADWISLCHWQDLGHPNRTEDGAAAGEVQAQYRRLMDNMMRVGVTRMVIDQSLVNGDNPIPCDASRGWSVHPNALPILDYAKAIGMGVGLYNGGGNYADEMRAIYSSEVAFLEAEKPEWKALGVDGQPIRYRQTADDSPRPMNCLAHLEFADWYARIQASTIEKHGLFWWGWDSTHAWQIHSAYCYAANHNHLPGECHYSLWRAMRAVQVQLRESCPGVWLQGYWGAKRMGPFALSELDTHENYYECAVIPGPGEPQPAPGQQHHLPMYFGGYYDEQMAWPVATDLRMQYWLNYNERFLPPYLTYAIADDRREELLAAIAAGGAVILRSAISDDNIEFFKSWLAFASENEDILQHTYLGLYGPPRRGKVDGWAHVRTNGGFIFLFNANRHACTVEVPLTGKLGLAEGSSWSVRLREPHAGAAMSWDGRRAFATGSLLNMDVEAETVIVLEIYPAPVTPQEACDGQAVAVKATGAPQPAFMDLAAYESERRGCPDWLAWDEKALESWAERSNF